MCVCAELQHHVTSTRGPAVCLRVRRGTASLSAEPQPIGDTEWYVPNKGSSHTHTHTHTPSAVPNGHPDFFVFSCAGDKDDTEAERIRAAPSVQQQRLDPPFTAFTQTLQSFTRPHVLQTLLWNMKNVLHLIALKSSVIPALLKSDINRCCTLKNKAASRCHRRSLLSKWFNL